MSYTAMHVCTLYTAMPSHWYMLLYTHTHTHTHIHTRMYKCVLLCLHTGLCFYIHTHTHMLTNAHCYASTLYIQTTVSQYEVIAVIIAHTFSESMLASFHVVIACYMTSLLFVAHIDCIKATRLWMTLSRFEHREQFLHMCTHTHYTGSDFGTLIAVCIT